MQELEASPLNRSHPLFPSKPKVSKVVIPEHELKKTCVEGRLYATNKSMVLSRSLDFYAWVKASEPGSHNRREFVQLTSSIL
jgi:hypothetical protein